MEFLFQLALPLFGEVRWAQHGKPSHLAPLEKLLRDQACFDCFADPDIVRDEQPDRIEPQRHEERYELVRSGLDRDLPKATKWPGNGPGGDARSVSE